jgi:hypothetical protein
MGKRSLLLMNIDLGSRGHDRGSCTSLRSLVLEGIAPVERPVKTLVRESRAALVARHATMHLSDLIVS